MKRKTTLSSSWQKWWETTCCLPSSFSFAYLLHDTERTFWYLHLNFTCKTLCGLKSVLVLQTVGECLRRRGKGAEEEKTPKHFIMQRKTISPQMMQLSREDSTRTKHENFYIYHRDKLKEEGMRSSNERGTNSKLMDPAKQKKLSGW